MPNCCDRPLSWPRESSSYTVESPAFAPSTNNAAMFERTLQNITGNAHQKPEPRRGADLKRMYTSSSSPPEENAITETKNDYRDLQTTKTQLEKACDMLRLHRDRLLIDIRNCLEYPFCAKDEEETQGEKRVASLVEQFKRAFEMELQSIQEDIETAKKEYTRLQAARDEILSEMVLLNTKNAELNEINNDLARRLSEREREAAAFMAGTNFLDSGGKKGPPNTITAPAPASSVIIERPKKMTHKRIMFFGRSTSASTSSASLSSTKDEEYDDEKQGEQEGGGRGMETEDVCHRFGQATFIMKPMRCEACGEKLWGTTELKCQVCGIGCHTRCVSALVGGGQCGDNNSDGGDGERRRMSSKSSSAMSDGMTQPPVLPKEKEHAIFGNELAKQLSKERSCVPEVVRICVEAVEARGMEYEGIYRKSGRTSQMRQIQQLFEDGHTPDLKDSEQWDDICAITSTLKHYFQSLPDPLLTYDLHDSFINAIAQTTPDKRLDEFQRLLHSCLPKENYETLRYLVRHLSRVHEKKDKNLMTISNLSVIFGQTLLRDPDENKDMLEMRHKIEVVGFILSHADRLFDQQQEQ
ncbi:Rho GTPase activation protein [Dichotomocladium elegans]|nr:Rho GTPase activation protein [Dichotomocladium elegans]